MSDTGTITVDMSKLTEKFDEIAKLDEILDAASGNKDAGKRAIANQIATETESQTQKMVSNLVAAVQKIEDKNVLVGAYTAIQKALKDSFGEGVDTFLAKLVEERTSDAPKVSPEELEQVAANRKQLVGEWNALKNIL